MKRILLIALSFFNILIWSQSQRFIYEYRFVEDSTAKDQYKTEVMYLDIARKGSKFFSREKYISDSIMEEKIKKGSHDFSKIKFGMVPYTVEKSYPDYKIILYNRLDTDEYKVTEDRKLNWKILPDKEKIGEFNAQKAVADFAGRQWVAWFATDIPIQDGPYKFYGLPGLIIKVKDRTYSHSFLLKGIKKLKPDEDWLSENDKTRFGSLITVNQEKYKKQFIEIRNNPGKSLRQMIAGGRKVMLTDEKGNQLDINEVIREQEKEAKEKNAKNNNVLELDLLQ